MTGADARAALKNLLRPLASGGIALAFSGGVDSSLLLALLAELREERDFPLLAVTMVSAFQKPGEIELVRAFASAQHVHLEIFPFDPLALPELEFNPPERCYFCKKTIFSRMKERASALGLGVMLDGTNADDLHVYRPGRKALAELGVRSPFAELGITKKEIRNLAAQLGLECASRPAAPCLATRFEYGARLTPEKLARAAAAEAAAAVLLPPETPFRVRVHGEDLARLEVPAEVFPLVMENREKFISALKHAGFRQISLDLQGFRSGSMDEPPVRA